MNLAARENQRPWYQLSMKVALVHDWLVTFGGAEKVLKELLELYPSNLYTLVADRKRLVAKGFDNKRVKTSFIQKLPRAHQKYRSYLPLFPIAIEQFDLSHLDLVISSSHSVAKGVLTNADQLHICYCHTPMRYAWDLYQDYLRKTKLKSGMKGIFAKCLLHYLRIWDVHASSRVNAYVANSKYVARRIRKIYGRDATVIYPPVDVETFELCEKKDDYYLTASRFVPYKRVDLIVEAFSHLPDKKLIVIGEGPEMEKIKEKGKKNIEIIGNQSDEMLKKWMQKARAFIFAAIEDFGILPIEAQACGTPVIAYGKGGILETVIPNKTGIFFETQTVSALIEAIATFETMRDSFNPKNIHKHAQPFNKKRFQLEFKSFVQKQYDIFQS